MNKDYVLTIEGELYKDLLIKEISFKSNNVDSFVTNFIQRNKLNKAIICINEIQKAYKVGNTVCEDINTAYHVSQLKQCEITRINIAKTIKTMTV